VCCDNYTQLRVSPHTSACVIIHNLVYDVISVCCSVLQCVAVCCSVLQCAAVCCSVLQCVDTQSRVWCHLCVLLLHTATCMLSSLCITTTRICVSLVRFVISPPPKTKGKQRKEKPFSVRGEWIWRITLFNMLSIQKKSKTCVEKGLATRCDDYIETLQCVRGFARGMWRYTRTVRADLAQCVCGRY